jgi:hypothetical protein
VADRRDGLAAEVEPTPRPSFSSPASDSWNAAAVNDAWFAGSLVRLTIPSGVSNVGLDGNIDWTFGGWLSRSHNQRKISRRRTGALVHAAARTKPRPASIQFIQQRLGVFEVGGVEALGEPVIRGLRVRL